MDQQGCGPNGSRTDQQRTPPVRAGTRWSMPRGLIVCGGLLTLTGAALGGINLLRWIAGSLPYQDAPEALLQQQRDTLAAVTQLMTFGGQLLAAGVLTLATGLLLRRRARRRSRQGRPR